MKSRFTTLDLIVAVSELESKLLNLRVNNIYDCNNKTFLIKFQKPDVKEVLLIECGIRIHTTTFNWPKNPIPNGFSMKLRKHLRGKRLVKIEMVNNDRVVLMQFGENEVAFNLIIELYDKGNLVLTDCNFTILHMGRVFSQEDTDVNIRAGEIYPSFKIKEDSEKKTEPETQTLESKLAANPSDNIMKILNHHLNFGPNLIEHVLFKHGFPKAKSLKCSDISPKLAEIAATFDSFQPNLENLTKELGPVNPCVIFKENTSLDIQGNKLTTETFTDFYTHKFSHLNEKFIKPFETFNKAVDEFFSESKRQKEDQEAKKVEKSAVKKLNNARKNHELQIVKLKTAQTDSRTKAELVEDNIELVSKALLVVNSMVANQLDWAEIENLLNEAKMKKDRVACSITSLKLSQNKITMLLFSKLENSDEEEVDSGSDLGLSSDSESESDSRSKKLKSKPGTGARQVSSKVDLDLALSVYGNISALHSTKKTAAKKEVKTVDAGHKALKSAEQKAIKIIKQSEKIQNIRKSRKTYWFEKFSWFITSENYVCIAGKDAQQNEMIVKKYLKNGDAYIHADIHGASTVVLKNHSKIYKLPQKSLVEAGNFALINSSAWDAKIVTDVYWVNADQVSKTAQSGEYLSTGSFMIRGKKNFLGAAVQNLTVGFGMLFKLEEDSVGRHKNERCVNENVELEFLPGAEERLALEGEKKREEVSLAELGLESGEEEETESKRGASDGSEDDDGDDDVDDNVDDNDVDNNVNDDVDDDETTPRNSTSSQNKIISKSSKAEKSSQRQISPNERERRKEDDNFEFPESDLIIPTLKGANGCRGPPKIRSLPAWKQAELDKKNNDPKKVQNQVRGKKGKNKKMKQKYKDQDEEDRQAIIKMINATGENDNNSKKNRRRAKKGHQLGKKGNLISSSQPAITKVIKLNAIKAEKMNQSKDNADNQISRSDNNRQGRNLANDGDDDDEDNNDNRTEKNSKNKSSTSQPTTSAATNQEPDITSDFTYDLFEMNDLTSRPTAEDTILFAIPITAPYSTMANYKYKVKMQPGTTKKGKAARTAVTTFFALKECNNLEKDLIKAVNESELFKNLPGKVKLVNTGNLQNGKGKHK